MGHALLVTGAPGVGKTTLIRTVVAALPRRFGGFVTEEIREEGRRVGFRVRSLDGAEAVLAHVRGVRGPRVGRFQVDVAGFERIGVTALEAAMLRLMDHERSGRVGCCGPCSHGFTGKSYERRR